MGVGGGFIMVPALIYLLKVPTNVVVGTSLFQIIFVAAYTTLVHSTANQTVDVVLAFVLMVGGVAGAQYGAKAGQKLRGEQLRALLAVLVLAVALRLAFDLFSAAASLYSLTGLGFCDEAPLAPGRAVADAGRRWPAACRAPRTMRGPKASRSACRRTASRSPPISPAPTSRSSGRSTMPTRW